MPLDRFDARLKKRPFDRVGCGGWYGGVRVAVAGVWRDEPRVDRQRVASGARPAAVPQHLHGVSGGRTHARSPEQEGPPLSAQDGRQLPQVGGGAGAGE